MTIIGRTFTTADLRKVVWTAAQAFVSTAVILGSGFWKAPNFATGKAVFVACAIAAGSAALSALKNWWLSDASVVK